MREIKTALVALPYKDENLQEIAKALSPAEVIFCPAGDKAARDARLPEADIALVGGPPSPDALRRADRLGWLHCDLVGMESVYTPEMARRKNLIFTSASGRSSAALAEHVLLFMIALSHRLPQLYEAQRKREWLSSLPPGTATLRGRTVGVLGAGSIGTEVARLCKAFGMTTVGYRRSAGRDNPAFAENVHGRSGLAELLGRSDFVVLALPLTSETRGILGSGEFALMKPTAFLVNIGRGGLLNEDDLIAAIQSKVIAGAGLDTFAVEPLPASSPLWTLDNVLITPHRTPPQPEKDEYSLQLILDNIRAYRGETPMRNVLSPHYAYSP